MFINRSPVSFSASLRRVILQHLYLPGKDRVKNIYERVLSLSEEEVSLMLADVDKNFQHRHRKLHQTFLKHFQKSYEQLGEELLLSDKQKLLLGSYFTKEYSTQSAALFNPSIVLHPNQAGIAEGSVRFVISLRATGEGHISSIEFRTGIVSQNGEITMQAASPYATRSEKNSEKLYDKDFVFRRLAYFKDINFEILALFPETFTATEAEKVLEKTAIKPDFETTKHAILEIIDTNYHVMTDDENDFGEKVIFPNAKGESMGMEDVRFVAFEENGKTKYYGTYTAYDGKTIKTQMIETDDFVSFEVKTLYGNAIKDKGMALFPEKIDGKYAMIARQGGEIMTIMYSENLYFWDSYQPLICPKYDWEFTQMGNCGSPIKTEKGWFLLTHAVGPMRRYVISAALLDLENPSKVLERLHKPLIEPLESEREGYVPNVVYTCGWLAHKDIIVIPYAMSDTACGIIWIRKQELIDTLLEKTIE